MQTAEEARDEGVAAVIESHRPWHSEALQRFRTVFSAGDEGTGEDFRLRLLETGLRKPAHPNAWGALVLTLCKRGVVVKTGLWLPLQTVKSHARLTPVLRVTENVGTASADNPA
jgi:hypothetical protein